MANTNSSINKKTKKRTRCALGSIRKQQVVIAGQLHTVFDARKRFSVEGEKKGTVQALSFYRRSRKSKGSFRASDRAVQTQKTRTHIKIGSISHI